MMTHQLARTLNLTGNFCDETVQLNEDLVMRFMGKFSVVCSAFYWQRLGIGANF